MEEQTQNQEIQTDTIDVEEDRDTAFDMAIAEAKKADEIIAARDTNIAEDVEDDTGQEYETTEQQAAPKQEDDPVLEEPEDDINTIPQSWGKKRAAIWEKVPVEARAVVKERERQLLSMVSRQVNEVKSIAAPISAALNHVDKYTQQWALGKNPVTREQGIIRGVEFYEHFKKEVQENPAKIIKEIMDAKGISVSDLEEHPAEAAESELRKEINLLKSKVETQEQSVVRQQQEQYQGILVSEYNKFAETKSPLGALKYPQANNPQFANALGSLVNQLAKVNPEASIRDLISQGYKQLGGQIHNGSNQPRSNNNQNIERAKAASKHGYLKSGIRSQAKTVYESDDDAYEATFREYGLID